MLLGVALTLGAVLAVGLFRAERNRETLGYTECPWRGDARVTLAPGVATADTLAVRMHEEVHAAQCRELGPMRYRIRNLTARGKLALEAPAYCAGARARLALGMDTLIVQERLGDDATAAFVGAASPEVVRASLRSSCPDIVPHTFLSAP